MENILNYVRGLLTGGLGFNRKRRAVDECDNLVSPKVRRISSSQMSNGEDDWFSTASSHNSFRRRSALLPKQDTIKQASWLPSKDLTSIVLDDDDDDVIEIKKPHFDFTRHSFKQTSTPNCSKMQQNGANDDDIIFVKSTPSNRRLEAKKKGFDYIKSPLLGENKLQNGARKKETSPMIRMSSKPDFPIPRKHSTALEHSFRLEERKRYKELLSRPQFTMKNLFDSYNDFKSFKFGSSFGFRGKKLVDLANEKSELRKSDRLDVIDLTADERRRAATSASRRSTADVIKDVLRKHDDVVVIKDGDSDVEILPNPPSPRSDFVVERCNSLKGFVHPSEPAHNDWIGNEIKKHDEAIQKRQKLIEEQKQSLERFNSINGEIRVKLLNDKVNECLHIKDVLLPVDVAKENPFKELTPEQNERVDNAFRKKSPSEILVSKFNMNITRADLLTLSGLSWLNDEVINFYMNLIIERGTNKNFPMAYAMNTFFYPKILATGQNSVRRWTRRVDIFSYDLLAVPIHLGMHWCMAIIDFRKRTISYYDSMGSPNKQCLSTLLQYLRDEHLDKKKTDIDLSDWRLSSARDIPQQMNGSDCGMFSITFAEFLTRDADITFSQENMPYLRRKVCAEILEGKLFIS